MLEVAEAGDKEAEPRRKGREALNLSFSGQGRTSLPWRERESENCSCCHLFNCIVIVDVPLSMVDFFFDVVLHKRQKI